MGAWQAKAIMMGPGRDDSGRVLCQDALGIKLAEGNFGMTRMTVYDDRNSPPVTRVMLTEMKNTIGLVPNLAGVMAGAPQVLQGLSEMLQRFMLETSLSQTERHITLLAGCLASGNDYCLELQSHVAARAGVSDGVIRAVREGRSLRKKRLNALRDFVVAVVDENGAVEDTVLDTARKAGLTDEQLLEALMGISIVMIWRYVGGVAQVSVDEELKIPGGASDSSLIRRLSGRGRQQRD